MIEKYGNTGGTEIAGFAGGVANYYSGGEKTRRLPQMPRDTEIRKKKEIGSKKGEERKGDCRIGTQRRSVEPRESKEEAEIEIEKAGERAGVI